MILDCVVNETKVLYWLGKRNIMGGEQRDNISNSMGRPLGDFKYMHNVICLAITGGIIAMPLS